VKFYRDFENTSRRIARSDVT